MRKMLLALPAAAALLIGGAPAQAAAPLEFKDAAGDATYSPTSGVALPVPNEPTLDLTNVRIHRVGDTIEWTARLSQASTTAPTGFTGRKYTFAFGYGAGSYTLSVVDDAIYGGATELRGGVTGSTNPTPCGRCLGKVDPKAGTVVITTPVASLGTAIRTVDKEAPKFAPGSKLKSITVTTFRTHGVGHAAVVRGHFSYTSDVAQPATGTEFTV